MDKMNEGLWNGIVRRGITGEVRQEDKLPDTERYVLDTYFKLFVKHCGSSLDGKYELELGEFLTFMADFSNNYRIDMFDYDGDLLRNYVKNNWEEGECIFQKLDDMVNSVDEGLWNDIVKRGTTGELKKEDQLDPVNAKALDKYMKMYTDKDSFDGYEISGKDKLWAFKHYVVKYRDLFKYMEDYAGYDIHTIISYIEDNWETGMCIGQKLDDMYKSMNEGLWNDVVRRGITGDVKRENELDDKKVEYIKNHLLYTYSYRLTYNDKNDVVDPDVNDCCDIIKGFYKNPDLNDIIAHIRRNWSKGENYHDFIRDAVDEWRQQAFDLGFKKKSGESIRDTLNDWWNSIDDKYSKVDILLNNDVEIKEDEDPDEVWDDLSWKKSIEIYLNENGMNEGLWNDVVRRGTTGEIRKEDEITEDDRKILNSYIEGFGVLCSTAYGLYELTLDNFISFITGSLEDYPYTERIVDHIKRNWEKGENILDEIRKGKVNECDAVAPNGGVVFGDIQGMGPITLPGECGEKGSGDLPMPSGRLYQQVAPFGTFIKMKKTKKKRKKFRKEDEPCVHSPNGPMYNYVDDYRDYVDRTYDKIK